MSTLTTEANNVANRSARMAKLMRPVEATLAGDLADAMRGINTRDRTGPPTGPPDPEPPTGHSDPTGDAAASGSVAAVRRRQARMMAAVHAVDRALDHAERVMRAEIATPAPWTQVDTAGLCEAHGCNRLKEPDSTLCAECSVVAGRIQREADTYGPICQTCNDRRVESYQTQHGVAFRGMVEDEFGRWTPRAGATPQCQACRRDKERRAA